MLCRSFGAKNQQPVTIRPRLDSDGFRFRAFVAAILATLSFISGSATAGDDPPDPISKLGQRSALERWKDARTEWMTPGMLRRERRQQRHGVAPEEPSGTDPTAPEAPAIVPLLTEPPQEPVRIENEPSEFPAPPPAAFQFIAPPRPERDLQREGEAPAEPYPAGDVPSASTVPRPFMDSLTTESPEQPGRSNLLPESPPPPGGGSGGPSPSPENHVEAPPVVTRPQDAPPPASRNQTPTFIPVGRPIQILERPVEPAKLPEPEIVVIPLPPVPDDVEIELDPIQAPAQETAFLPQIPRTPVAPSPTPAPPPPTRIPPAPAPRLPDERPSFIVPRYESLVPPAPDSAPRVAGPVELPQLKKITDIQPFRTCSTDGGGVKMCPPNTANGGADRCPEQIPLPVFEGAERNFIDLDYCWEASNLFHTPLWFEDVSLERYGHTYCEPIQSIASVGKFGTQLVGLPYQMAMAPVHKREYPLGYYRPGDPAPHKAYQIPLNAEAAIKAAYVYTGMSFIVP